MQPALTKFLRSSWRVLTAVPGWPDAPRSVRIARALPILVPCLGLIALAVWKKSVLEAGIEAGRLAHQPMQAVQEEIAALRLECSDQEAVEIGARATAAAGLAVEGPDGLPLLLESLKARAARLGWEAAWQASESPVVEPAPDAQTTYLQVRGKLAPVAGKNHPFASLLALLEEFSASDKRIDLTRLAIRADGEGLHTAEVNLRLVRLVTHEKTAQ